ncbi:uncharacterized protein SOCE26_026770 [Sorangium cellulosum]|uniref:Uncharacterized protein n=1 Tax=Sorangium cellulosum TaxID=56 RepID=A0A2L0EPN0_SORCE|nr:uncharacterized protein SOCE26_026770 [Sorangium cellulosum]
MDLVAHKHYKRIPPWRQRESINQLDSEDGHR